VYAKVLQSRESQKCWILFAVQSRSRIIVSVLHVSVEGVHGINPEVTFEKF